MQLSSASVLRVGIDDAPPIPMQMGAPHTGNFRGYEVELLAALAERLGVTLTYRRALWSVILQELANGDIDLVCSAATVTPQRVQQVDFCRPHLELALALVTRDRTQRGTAAALDLTSSRIGVRRGTTAEDYLRTYSNGAPALVSESNDDLYHALARGDLDGVIDDSPIALHFAHSVGGLQYAGPFPDTKGEYAIMLRRGDGQRRATINAALQQLEADGTLPRLRQHWFDSPHLLVV